MRLIDADDFGNRMYHEVFEKYTDMQKWDSGCWMRYKLFENVLREQPTIDPAPHWIPVTERLPEEFSCDPVNITYVNDNPEPYYSHIKSETFTGTAIYYDGKWWWYSAICEDMLAEYGISVTDEMDKSIRVIAWMPLPKAYREDNDG